MRNTPVQTKDEILVRMRDHEPQLRELGVRRLGLFGSFVRGQQAPASDVDVLLEFEPGKKTFDRFMGISLLLEEIFPGMETEPMYPFAVPSNQLWSPPVCGDGFCWVSERLTCEYDCAGAVVLVPIDSELSDDEAGYVFVWVLTTPDFDAAEVDPATATLGNNDGSDTPVATKKKGKPEAKFKDVDRDGDDDLRLQFKTKELEKNPKSPRRGH